MKKLLEDYVAHFRAGWYGGTEKFYRLQFGRFSRYFAGKELSEITTRDCADWIHHMLKVEQLRSKTAKERAKIAKHVLNFAVRQKLLAVNPLNNKADLPRIRNQKVYRMPFTHSEYLQVLVEAQNAQKHAGWWVTAITIGWHTGIRVGDVACLEWQENIIFGKEWMKVWPKKKANVEECLTIPMDPELFSHLLALYNNRDADEQRPFVLPRMNYLYHQEPREVDRGFRKICDAVGLHEHTFHSFRHGFVSRMLNADVNYLIIQSLTGQSLSQIKAYAHISIEAKISALNKSTNQPETSGASAEQF
jgi:integrase